MLVGSKHKCSLTNKEVADDCKCSEYREIPPIYIKLDLEDGELGLF
jgi:hypothetical protein